MTQDSFGKKKDLIFPGFRYFFNPLVMQVLILIVFNGCIPGNNFMHIEMYETPYL